MITIDCIITNRKIVGQIIDVMVSRSYDIGSDPLPDSLQDWDVSQMETIKENQGMKGEDFYKAYLSQEESMQFLFQQWLHQEFQQREANIDIGEEWSCIESAVHKVSSEGMI